MGRNRLLVKKGENNPYTIPIGEVGLGVLVPTLIEVDGTGVTLEPGVTAAENRKMKVWTLLMDRLHEETNLILQKNSADDIYIQILLHL